MLVKIFILNTSIVAAYLLLFLKKKMKILNFRDNLRNNEETSGQFQLKSTYILPNSPPKLITSYRVHLIHESDQAHQKHQYNDNAS